MNNCENLNVFDFQNQGKKQSPKFKSVQPTLPRWRASWYQKLAIHFLGTLPSNWQRYISKKYAQIYNTSFSKKFINAYCWYHYNDPNYLSHYKPPNGKQSFESFQDFFTREFKSMPFPKGKNIWCCEGNLCHAGKIKDIPQSNVKGQIRDVYHIFGLEKNDALDDYYFTNVFLHNKNYHRIHSPISGKISRIQHLKGDLVVLRPWIYKDNPSIPAFRNERINIDIEDEDGRTWYLSIVGGPAVGSIELAKGIEIGVAVNSIQELAVFHLGSTCCMASPIAMSDDINVGDWIELGDKY